MATVVGGFYGVKTSMQCRADNPTPSAFHEPGRLVVLGWPEIQLVGIFLRTSRLALTNDVHAVFGFPGVLVGLERPVRSVSWTWVRLPHRCVPFTLPSTLQHCFRNPNSSRRISIFNFLLARRRVCIVALAVKYIFEHGVRHGIRTYVSSSFESK